MKGGLEGRFESLIRQRFQQRDRQFGARLPGVKQEHNRRVILTSSITIAATVDNPAGFSTLVYIDICRDG